MPLGPGPPGRPGKPSTPGSPGAPRSPGRPKPDETFICHHEYFFPISKFTDLLLVVSSITFTLYFYWEQTDVF